MDRIDPVKKVFTERAGRDHFRQVTVRRANQPDIDRHRRIAAHARHGTALDDRQQFGLQMVRQVADLVEKERPARGHFEFAGPVAAGIRKSPLDMAEQLALEKRLGQGPHIDAHQRLVPPRGKRMDLPRQHILARAVFPRNQDRGIGRRHLFNHLPEGPHSLGITPEHRRLAAEFTLNLAQLLNFLLRNAQVIGRLQRGDQFRIIPGLHNEIDRPLFDRLDGQIDVGIGCKKHHLRGRRLFLHFGKPVKPFVAVVDTGRKVHIEQHHVEFFRTERRNQRGRRRKRHHPVEIIAQQEFQRREDAFVVIHDQYTARLTRHFIVSLKLPVLSRRHSGEYQIKYT